MSDGVWVAVVGLALTIVGQTVLLIFAATKFGTTIKLTVENLVSATVKLENAIDRLDATVAHLDRRVTVLEDRGERIAG